MGFVRQIRIMLLSPQKRKMIFTLLSILFVILIFSWLNASSPRKEPPALPRSSNDWARGSLLDPRALKPYEQTVEFRTPDLKKWGSSSRQGNVWIVAEEYVGLGRYGGIGTAFYELAKVLAKAKHNVTILYLQKLPKTAQSVIEKHQTEFGIRVLPLEAGGMPIFASGQAQTSHRVFEQLKNAIEEKKERIDIVHFADFDGYAYFSLLAKHQGWAFGNTRFILGLHGISSWAWLLSGTFYTDKGQVETSFFEKKSLDLADVIVSPSSYMLDYLAARGTQFKDKPYRIQNCITPPTVFEGRNTQPISEIVFYGRLEKRKGTDVFIDALSILLKQNDTAASMIEQVTFLGRDLEVPERGSMKGWITRKFKETPQLSSVKLVFKDSYGRDEAIEYLGGPSVLAVIPSLNENSPYTVFECLVNRIRFIASRVGGIPELVHAEDADRLLFSPMPKALAKHLTATIEKSKDASFFQWAHVAQSAAETADMWLALHQQLLAETDSSAYVSNWHIWRPRVSVCITHYERPALLLHAIDSIRRQNYKNVQLIVVDDKSSQATREILKAQVLPALKLLGGELIFLEENSYLGAARNRAAERMRGDYFLFLDDDDLLKPHALTRLVSVAEHTGAEVLTTHFHGFASIQNPLDATAAEEVGLTTYAKEGYTLFIGSSVSMGLIGNYIGGANIFMKRELFQRLKGFTEFKEAGCEDWELLLRAELSGAHHELVPEPLLLVRQTPGSMAKTMERFLCTYRALVPVLNDVAARLPGVEDFLLLAKGLLRKSEQERVRPNRLASSLEDFSDVQGGSGWSYYFLKTDSLDGAASNLPSYFYGGSWIGVESSLDIPFVASDAQHPWVDGFTAYSAVRRWTSSVSGDITVRFSYRKHVDECGDGVTLRLRKDREALWSAHCQDTSVNEVVIEMSVKVGTILDFVVDAGTTDHCDTLIILITITVRERDTAGMSREELRRASGSTVIANSAADFGLPGWKHYFVRQDTLQELPATYHEGEATWRWRDSPQSWPMVRREDVHPYRSGTDAVCAVQRYELSADEKLFVLFDARHQPPCENDSCGDGVHVTLRVDDTNLLWEGDIFRTSKHVSSEILDLKAGSHISVTTCPKATDVSDLLKIVIRLKYASAKEVASG